jgi:hypothetical protein
MVFPLIYKAIDDNELANGLKHAADAAELATKFWQPITNYPVNLIRAGNYSLAQALLLNLLYKCKNIDPTSFLKIHKGNPYYFLGIASYLMNDIETATFFMDSSVSEDLRYGSDAIDNPSPSTYFLALEGDKSFQFAKQLTEDAESKVKRAIDLYNSMPDRSPSIPDLTINTLREKFLFPALSSKTPPGWRTLATAFISFFIGWDFRNEFFDIRPGIRGPY